MCFLRYLCLFVYRCRYVYVAIECLYVISECVCEENTHMHTYNSEAPEVYKEC